MDWFTQYVTPVFPAVYGIAVLVSHFAPDHTIAGKIARWFLSGAGKPKV